MALQPHFDAKGQQIGVLIPIEDWKKLRKEYPDLQKKLHLDLQTIFLNIVFPKAIKNIHKNLDIERVMKRKFK